MTDAEIIKANDILDKFDFFSQRAGRELWSDKPKDIQDKDIENFLNDVKFLKDLITRLQADKEALIAGQETLQKTLAEKIAEVERLKAEADMADGYAEAVEERAIKEFAERLKTECRQDRYSIQTTTKFGVLDKKYLRVVDEGDIDNLVKEMVDETE